MYELNNKIRLIDVSSYLITNPDEFAGFVSGIISQDHDLEQMYLDNFLVNAHLKQEEIEPAIEKLEKISNMFHVDFIISVSVDESELPETLKEKVVVSL